MIWRHQRVLPRLGTLPSAPTTSPGAVRAGAALQAPARIVPVAAYSVFTGGASAGHALTASPSYILTQAAWCAAVRDYFVALNAVDDFVAAYAIDYSVAVTALRAPWVLALAKARQGRSRLKGEPLRNKVDAWCATTTPPGRWHRTATKHPCGK